MTGFVYNMDNKILTVAEGEYPAHVLRFSVTDTLNADSFF
jgi:hypothetical protein